MAHWTFLRHGESVANAEGWLSGHRDVPLTAAGEAQARDAGRALASVSFARALTSDLQRARLTAELVIAGREVPLTVHPALRERHLGVFEGLDREALRADGGFAVLLGWGTAPEGGESHLDMARRTLPWLASVDDGSDTLLVAHGGLLRVLIGLVDGVARDAIGRNQVANCAPEPRWIPRGTWAALLEGLDG